MKIFKAYFFLSILFFASSVIAAGDDINLNSLNYCKISKIEINDYEPEKFETTNNLLRKPGQEELYCGEKIIVHGVLLDQNCAPISDATIYVWQANCSGKYPYKPLKTALNKNLLKIDENTSFTGSGMATTNNKGEFHFITVYPPSMHGKPSQINMRVKHYRLGSFQTALKLRGNKVNNPGENPELNSISGIATKNNISVYDFKITIPGDSIKSY